MVMNNTNSDVTMKGAQSLDRSRDILCINSTYVLVLSGKEVLYTVTQPEIQLFSNNLLISSA